MGGHMPVQAHPWLHNYYDGLNCKIKICINCPETYMVMVIVIVIIINKKLYTTAQLKCT